MIENTIFTTVTLLAVIREQESPSDYWLSLLFNNQMTFETEWIEFEKVTTQRKLAPLVVPMAQGKPIYTEASHLARVKPAYVKPKDPVSLARVLKRRPGNLSTGSPGGTPQSRYNSIIADIMAAHRDAIERRWEWMASEAAQHGMITLEDDAYPETVVDFNRDPTHEITLGVGVRWGDSGVSILDDIETWRTKILKAKFGGPTNRITIGADVWNVMRKDAEIRELLKADSFRNNNNGMALNLGLRDPQDDKAQKVGTLSGTLEVWVYSDYYQDETGAAVPFMDPRDIVLSGPNVRGVRCFGAILDSDANFQPLPIFPKMWKNQDPSVTYCMSQSAPLMVPVNPNNTFRARVLA